MIGIVLAAGKGSRLGNRTTDIPKSLLKLNNEQTLLGYNISILNRLQVEKIYIVTGFNADKIESYVEDIDNIECIYNPFWNHCNVLGSLYMALPYINDDFLFLHADTLVGYEGWKLLLSYQGDIVIPFKKKVCGDEEMKVLLDEVGNLKEINKTMKPENADGEFLGIAKFSKNVVSYIQQAATTLFMSGGLNFYMEAVVEIAIKEKKDIKAFDIGSTKFVEVDFEEDYLLARQNFR